MEILEVPKTLEQLEAEGATIELKAVFKEGGLRLAPVKDPARPGFYLGVDKLSEDEKKGRSYYVEPEKLTLYIKEGTTFNLSEEVDKINWRWVKHSPHIANSFEEAQQGKYIWFYVHIQERESQNSVTHMESKLKAGNLILADDPINYTSRARLTGMDMRGQKIIDVKEYLLSIASKEPKKIIDAYDEGKVGLRLTLLNALDKGIIDFDGKVYTFNNVTLGMSEDAAVEFISLSRNKQIVELIQRDLETAGTAPAPASTKSMVIETPKESESKIIQKARPRGGA